MARVAARVSLFEVWLVRLVRDICHVILALMGPLAVALRWIVIPCPAREIAMEKGLVGAKRYARDADGELGRGQECNGFGGDEVGVCGGREVFDITNAHQRGDDATGSRSSATACAHAAKTTGLTLNPDPGYLQQRIWRDDSYLNAK